MLSEFEGGDLRVYIKALGEHDDSLVIDIHPWTCIQLKRGEYSQGDFLGSLNEDSGALPRKFKSVQITTSLAENEGSRVSMTKSISPLA